MEFRFADALDLAYPYSFHVKRADFDEVLFRNAVRHGVDAQEGTSVVDVVLDAANGSQVTAVAPDGSVMTWHARLIIDASGRDSYLPANSKLKGGIHGIILRPCLLTSRGCNHYTSRRTATSPYICSRKVGFG